MRYTCGEPYGKTSVPRKDLNSPPRDCEPSALRTELPRVGGSDHAKASSFVPHTNKLVHSAAFPVAQHHFAARVGNESESSVGGAVQTPFSSSPEVLLCILRLPVCQHDRAHNLIIRSPPGATTLAHSVSGSGHPNGSDVGRGVSAKELQTT